MAIKWNEETWYSRLATLLFFLLILTSLSFYVGKEYQTTLLYITAEVQAQDKIEVLTQKKIESLQQGSEEPMDLPETE